jgi:GNAT superfamily N-acetyltransferase
MANDALKIRCAQATDAQTIADFNMRMAMETESLQLDAPTVLAGVRAALGDPSKAIYFLAEIDRAVAGQLMITHEWSDWRNGDIWWIQSVYVHPDYRRRGVFKALYQFVEQQARAAEVVGIRLYVERANVIARRTYEELGLCSSHYELMEKFLK